MSGYKDRFTIKQRPFVGPYPMMANQTNTCPPHHFVIETPCGKGLSEAKCKKCGEPRVYADWIDTLELLPVQ